MPNYPYKKIGLPLDLENWEQLNTNFDQIATDIKNISGDVLAELIHKANLEYKAPVATFADLTTTYPNAKEGWAVQTLDDNKIYRFNGSNWVFVQQFGAGPFSDIYNRLDNLGLDVTAFGAVGMGKRTIRTPSKQPSTWRAQAAGASYDCRRVCLSSHRH